MKKQGDSYLKFITILLAVVIAAYVLLTVLLRSGSSYALETAVYCEVGDGVTVSGFVVREETVLTATAPIVVYELTEGEWVGAGQRVATGYQSSDAKQQREELSDLRAQREQLAYSATGSDNSNTAALDDEIAELLVRLSAQTSQRRLDAMHSTASELKPLVLRRFVTSGETELVEQRLAQIDARIAALSTQTGAGADAITADIAGYFSEQTDGLEAVLTPSALETMTLSEYRALSQDAAAPKNAIGRIVSGQKWYFVTELPADRAALCDTGDRLTVSFAAKELQELRMRVERVGPEEDGVCLLVLSCERNLQNVTALRGQTVDIVFKTYQGLRVPKTALYHIEGEDGVYVLEGARAAWKPVTVLYESGDSFVVKWDSSDTDQLWPKDEMILTSDDIYDRKVMLE